MSSRSVNRFLDGKKHPQVRQEHGLMEERKSPKHIERQWFHLQFSQAFAEFTCWLRVRYCKQRYWSMSCRKCKFLVIIQHICYHSQEENLAVKKNWFHLQVEPVRTIFLEYTPVCSATQCRIWTEINKISVKDLPESCSNFVSSHNHIPSCVIFKSSN